MVAQIIVIVVSFATAVLGLIAAILQFKDKQDKDNK